MNKLIALVKINLQVQKNTFFDEEPKKVRNKILGFILLGLMVIAAAEFYVVGAMKIAELNSIGNKYVFYIIMAIELFLVTLVSLYRIINIFYLGNNWRDIAIYPLKNRIILLAQFILSCYTNVSAFLIFFVPLITYGVLGSLSLGYFLKLIFYQVLLMVLPPMYIVLISITVLWIITLLSGFKSKNSGNAFIIVIDILEAVLTYLCVKNILNEKLYLYLSLIVIVGIVGFYFVIGNIYSDISKSGILYSKQKKNIETDFNNYEFKKRSYIKANFLRDLKIIIRTPQIRANCITMNFIVNLIIIILMLVFNFGGSLVKLSIYNSALYIQIFMWIISILNATAITSFSREGAGFHILNVLPMKKNKYILTKIYIALITHIGIFIWSNIYVFQICHNIWDILLLELVLISTIILMVMSNIKTDSKNMNLKWKNIKELFELERALKLTIPVNISILMIGIYALISNFVLTGNEFVSYLKVVLIIAVNILFSISDFNKIKRNIG